MTDKAIHQIVAGFRRGDAISDEALILRGLFRAHGYASEIFCEVATTAVESRAEAKDIDTLAARVKPGDIVILHLSIGSRGNAVFPTLDCKRVILYHNVTPAVYFERLNPSVAQKLEDGRRQVASLANAAHINLADSAYNAAELRDMGYRDARVLPLVVDADFGAGATDPDMLARLTDDKCVNLLFVGRVVPNKRHDKLLQVFHYFLHNVEPRSRLVIAGSSNGQEAYKSLLLGSVHTLELERRVLFTEFISAAALNACYAAASAFVCMSDHEGFCAPLLEAMAWGVPVFATASAAVPETLDGAGVLFRDAAPATIAETIGAVLRDAPLRTAILEKQKQRLARYRSRNVWAELSALLAL